MVEDLVLLKESLMKQIYDARLEIADLKKKKINKRADAWWEADGTAKQKEDFVRSQVSNLDCMIDEQEAEIEYLYNQIKVVDDRMELEFLE